MNIHDAVSRFTDRVAWDNGHLVTEAVREMKWAAEGKYYAPRDLKSLLETSGWRRFIIDNREICYAEHDFDKFCRAQPPDGLGIEAGTKGLVHLLRLIGLHNPGMREMQRMVVSMLPAATASDRLTRLTEEFKDLATELNEQREQSHQWWKNTVKEIDVILCALHRLRELSVQTQDTPENVLYKGSLYESSHPLDRRQRVVAIEHGIEVDLDTPPEFANGHPVAPGTNPRSRVVYTWGYSGTGPGQLAEAIAWHYLRYAQEFDSRERHRLTQRVYGLVSGLDQNSGWTITREMMLDLMSQDNDETSARQ
jgi:hypothetical protein